jgi:hypothetical protein
MPPHTAKQHLENDDLAALKKEMAEPRVARSARILDPPSITMPGTVEKIIPAVGDHQPEKAHIAIEGAEVLYREIRIDNTLQTEDGDDVSLKAGSKVEVTIEVKKQSRRYTAGRGQ